MTRSWHVLLSRKWPNFQSCDAPSEFFLSHHGSLCVRKLMALFDDFHRLCTACIHCVPVSTKTQRELSMIENMMSSHLNNELWLYYCTARIYFCVSYSYSLTRALSLIQITHCVSFFDCKSTARRRLPGGCSVWHAPPAARVRYIKLLVHPQSRRRSVIRRVSSFSRSDLLGFFNILRTSTYRIVYFFGWVSFTCTMIL